VRRLLKRSARFAWKTGVLIVGLLVLIAGIIMIFTPGPAVVFIPAGLALLATEFEWARKLLQRVRPMIDAAIEKAKRAKEAHDAKRQAKKAATALACPVDSPEIDSTETELRNSAGVTAIEQRTGISVSPVESRHTPV
jgi:uncharacterized protein (TIGR02611 family)